jgi:uncharacterized RDD family membrane protein YckC
MLTHHKNQIDPLISDLTSDLTSDSQSDLHSTQPYHYAGFWVRLKAVLIDSVLILLIIGPILTVLYGNAYWDRDAPFIHGSWDVILNYVLPAGAVILFWLYKSATPGKLFMHLTIIDAKTGQKPTKWRFIGRYAAYYVSILPLGAGLIWVAFDPKKQGWHDKLANTLVIHTPIQTESATQQTT